MGTILDVVILSVCVLLGIRGLFNGFVREILSLLAFVSGFFTVITFRDATSQWLVNQISISNTIAMVISIVVLFILGYLLVKIVEAGLSRFVSIIMLSGLNRVCGCLIGILTGIIVVHLLVVLIEVQEIFPDFAQALSLSDSKLLPWVNRISAFVIAFGNRG